MNNLLEIIKESKVTVVYSAAGEGVTKLLRENLSTYMALIDNECAFTNLNGCKVPKFIVNLEDYEIDQFNGIFSMSNLDEEVDTILVNNCKNFFDENPEAYEIIRRSNKKVILVFRINRKTKIEDIEKIQCANISFVYKDEELIQI